MSVTYLESLLGERENIILAARQHWFILAGSILLEVILILLIFAATVTASIFLTEYVAIIIAIGFVILLVPVATMMRDILNWTHRQFVITNRRVITISGIMNKNIIDSSLEKVNDIHMVQSALGRIFNYGDIEIMTGSELGANMFRRLENPVRYKKALLDAKSQLEGLGAGEDLRAKPALAPAAAITGVPDLITQLNNLRQQGLLTDEEFQQKKTQLLDRI